MCALRLLIADDHEIVRCGLCALLKSHPEWEVCAEAVDGQEAVDMARQLKPDIVILDIGMPNMNGLIAARQIRQTQPNQKILVLSVTDEEQLVQEVLAVGARGKQPILPTTRALFWQACDRAQGCGNSLSDRSSRECRVYRRHRA